MGALAYGMLTGDAGPGCYEDEVVAWGGDAHTVCVPVDTLTDPDRTVTFSELVAELEAQQRGEGR